MKQVILTGLRANNDLTLGNYFGGMLPIIDMAKKHADEYQVNMFIPDLHSFTTPIDHATLYDQIIHNARVFTAAGLPLDHPNIALYRQSFIPAHSELAWILDCFTGIGQLERMTQFKDKSKGKSEVSVGLFNYPVLMAADILIYHANYIPVGEDQTQHLEFTRDMAERMNSRFGEIFTVPHAVQDQNRFFGKEQALRIMDLQDPSKKMSKSDDTGKGVIFLNDSPDLAHQKVMSATTDSLGSVNYDKANQPGVTNLLEILALLNGQTVSEVSAEYQGMDRYGDFKRIVADKLKLFLEDFQQKLQAVDDQAVLNKLHTSEAAMNEVANRTLYQVQLAVGLRHGEE